MGRMSGSATRLLLPCLLVYLVLGLLMRWGYIANDPIIESDGKGYYAYLPALFIYDDLSFGFVDAYETKYYKPTHRVGFTLPTHQGTVNKYFVGTAVLMSPFFFLGHWAAQLNGVAQDGYSWPYQMTMCIGALFWVFLGALLFLRFLAEKGIGTAARYWTTLALLFGTGLLYYVVAEPTMSHIYSMAMVSAALFFAQRYFHSGRMQHLIALGAVMALIALIRPVNVLVALALPLAATDLAQFRSRLPGKGNWHHWLLALLIFMAVCCFQPIIYWMQTGSPWVWSYGEEGFDFSSPEIINVLFSYRKGLFVYTPLALLGLLGTIWHLRRNALQAGSSLLFLTVVTWVISSWWMWFYGGSYGMRPYLEFMPILLLGIAWALEASGTWMRRLMAVAIALLISVNAVQSYQYHNNILLWDGMTKESYHGLFLKTDRALAGYYHDHPKKWSYRGLDSLVFHHDFETAIGWHNERMVDGGYSEFGRRESYGPAFKVSLDSAGLSGVNLIRVEANVRVRSFGTRAGWVVTVQAEDGIRYWGRLPISPQLTGCGWNHVSHVFNIGPQQPGAFVETYLHKEDGSSLDVDDMKVKLIHAE